MSYNNSISSISMIEAGIDAAWAKAQVHTQNLVNVDTPNYKAKDVSFASTLLGMVDEIAMTGTLSPTITTRGGTTLRMDGNNVDSEYENGELYKAYVQYNLLIDKATGHYEKINTVLTANF